jgi:hypothetical protein
LQRCAVCDHNKQGTYYCYLKGHLKTLVLHPFLAATAANGNGGSGGPVPAITPPRSQSPAANLDGASDCGAAVANAASSPAKAAADSESGPGKSTMVLHEDAGTGPASSPAASGSAGPDTAPPGRSPGPSPRGGVADGAGGVSGDGLVSGAGGGFGVLGVGSKCEVLDADEWWKSRVVAWEPGRLQPPLNFAPPCLVRCDSSSTFYLTHTQPFLAPVPTS